MNRNEGTITQWDLVHKKAFLAEQQLMFKEEQLDRKILLVPPWKDKWWKIVGDMNIVRVQLLKVRKILSNCAEIIQLLQEAPELRGVPVGAKIEKQFFSNKGMP